MGASVKDSMQSITRDVLMSSKAPLFEYKPTFLFKPCPVFILNSALVFSVPISRNKAFANFLSCLLLKS